MRVTDLLGLRSPVFGTSPPDPNYSERKDFNGDFVIDIFDIVRLTPPTFGKICTP
jgi:hypothetical protein